MDRTRYTSTDLRIGHIRAFRITWSAGGRPWVSRSRSWP